MTDGEPTREELLTVLLQAPWVRAVDEDCYSVFWHKAQALLDRVDPDTLERLRRQAPPLDRHPRVSSR